MSDTEIEIEGAIEVIEPVKAEIKKIEKKDPFYDLIHGRRDKLLPMLDGDDTQLEKLARCFIFSLYKDNLIHCNQQSIIEGFIKVCQLKLDPSSGLGKLYLINYNGSLNVQVGYQGWLELLWRKPLVTNVYSHAVYEGDTFELEYGSTIRYKHIPMFKSDTLWMTYAVVKFNNGEFQIKTASLKEISESKAASKGSHSAHSPWNKYFDAMAQIVPLRKIGKNLALSISDHEFINNPTNHIDLQEVA